ncbi:MAG: hypothetical protein JWP74_457 [Marmoricola sp.]|nr:hypothetical protein [Marmoricola sp.]
MFMRRAGHTILIVAMTTTLTAFVQGVPQSAHADPDPTVLVDAPPVPGSSSSINFQVSSIAGVPTVINPGGTVPVKSLCVTVPASDGSVDCVGSSDKVVNEADVAPVDIKGYASKPQGLPGGSMSWILDEASSAVAILHGVKNDDLVTTFARPEIRSYVSARLLSILNKKLYGKPLTDEEQSAYDALEAIYKQRQVEQATWALDEYNDWSADPCAYVPPAPPVNSGLPAVPNDVRTSSKCSKIAALTQQYKFTNDTPPAEVFDAWAAYRHPTPSLVHSNDPEFRQMASATIAAIVASVGATLALGAVLAYAVTTVTSAVALATNFAAALSAVSGTAVAANSAFGTVLPAIGVFASAVAGAVTAVLAGVAIGAIGVYKLVEDMKPGQQLNERVTDAAKQTDALGITSRMADYAGLDMDTLQEPAGETPAAIHDPSFYSQLVAESNEWQIFTDDGNLIPDPTTMTASQEAQMVPTASDYKFLDNGTPVTNDYVQLMLPDGAVGRNGTPIAGYRIRISRGWLMVAEVTTSGSKLVVGNYVPQLSVKYIDPSGNQAQMSLLNHATPGSDPRIDFALNTLQSDGTMKSTISPSWSFKQNVSQNQTVTLQTTQPALPTINVVRTAFGDMGADHLMTLAANASTDTPTQGTTTTWTLQRLNDDGTVAETITTPDDSPAFQRRFDEPGRYRALVTVAGTRTPPGGVPTPFTASGRVEFTINQPDPEVLQAQVLDHPELQGARLLDLNLSQNTKSDTFKVDVDWANDGTDAPVTKHYTVQCVDTGNDTCNTGTLVTPADAPTNPQWSESPTFTPPVGQNYLPFVNVTITNSYGQVIKRVFPITPNGTARPTYDNDHPSATVVAGTDNTVDVVQIHPATALADQTLTIQPYIGQIIDQLPSGLRPDIEKKPDGTWWLQIKGNPSADSIGSSTFYFPFEQNADSNGFGPPPALVNLEVKAAQAPGYRAILRGVPAAFADRFYRNTYPNYDVQVAQVLDSGQTAFAPYTGTVMCKLVAGPATLFDKPCAQDKPFPWPTQKVSDTFQATVYLQSSTQEVSADGPYEVTSISTRFLDPQVSTTAPSSPAALTQKFTLKLMDPTQILNPFVGYTVTCSQDGRAYAPCFADGTQTLYRTPGSHTLDVKVVKAAPAAATTTVKFLWSVATPARTLGLSVPTTGKKLGTNITISGSQLLPGESYTVTIGGIKVATGKATNAGTFSRSVKIPKRLKVMKHAVRLTGANTHRSAVRSLRVT